MTMRCLEIGGDIGGSIYGKERESNVSSITTHLFSSAHLLRPHPPRFDRPDFELTFIFVSSLHRMDLLISNDFLFLGSI